MFRFLFLLHFQNEGGTAITVLRTSRRLQYQSRRGYNYQRRRAPGRLCDESYVIRYILVHIRIYIYIFSFHFFSFFSNLEETRGDFLELSND